MNAAIGLKESSQTEVLGLLDIVLADEYVLYTKTRNFHWNVVGLRFNDLHKFFESQYVELDGIVDEVAERSRALGGRALGSMKDFMANARLKESIGRSPSAEAMLGALLTDHETIIRSLRLDIETAGRLGDVGTEDFLTGLMQRHLKMAWMLRSFTS